MEFLILLISLAITSFTTVPIHGRLVQKNMEKTTVANPNDNQPARVTRAVFDEDTVTVTGSKEDELETTSSESFSAFTSSSTATTQPPVYRPMIVSSHATTKPEHTSKATRGKPKISEITVAKESSESIESSSTTKTTQSTTTTTTTTQRTRPSTRVAPAVRKPVPKYNVIDRDEEFQDVKRSPVKIESNENEDEDFNLDDYDFDVNHDEFSGRGKPVEPRVKSKAAVEHPINDESETAVHAKNKNVVKKPHMPTKTKKLPLLKNPEEHKEDASSQGKLSRVTRASPNHPRYKSADSHKSVLDAMIGIFPRTSKLFAKSPTDQDPLVDPFFW